MADDYSGMPDLVDNSYPSGGGGGGVGQPMAFVGQPFASFPGQPSSWPGPGMSAMSDHAPAWAAQQQQTPFQQWGWPSSPSGGPAVMSSGVYPAPVDPARPHGGEGWPSSPGRYDEAATPRWAQMDSQADSSPRKYDDDGYPIRSSVSRSVTPFSSKTSSPSSSGSGGVARSRSLRSLGESNMRPPREWRADFSMSKSGALGAALGSLFSKKRSASISLTDPLRANKISLHPYLRFASSNPPMYHDLRLNPSTVRFRALERAINVWDLTRFACEPPLPHMRLYSAHYPWFVDVESQNPVGVTLHELFSALYASMVTPITQGDFWNNEMDEGMRERIGRAWAERCEDEQERRMGVRRVDFLMGRVVLEGFVKGKEGMWEMKLRKL